MPPATNHPRTPSANPQHPDGDQAPDTTGKAKADDQAEPFPTPEQPDPAGLLYVIVATPREGADIVELHTADTAEARVSLLTYGSKQHRKEADEDGVDVPEGGGTHEINRRDVHVYKLNASEIANF